MHVCAKKKTALEATQSKLQVSSFGRSKSMKIEIFTPYFKSLSELEVYQTNLGNPSKTLLLAKLCCQV